MWVIVPAVMQISIATPVLEEWLPKMEFVLVQLPILLVESLIFALVVMDIAAYIVNKQTFVASVAGAYQL